MAMHEQGKLFLAGKPRTRRWVISMVLAGAIPLSLAGCYGSFPLTTTLYEFNGEISDSQFIHSVGMWVLGVFLPIYGFTIFADFVVLNLVEFWSGETTTVSKSVEQEDGTTVTMETSEDGQALTMVVSQEDKVIAERRFVRRPDNHLDVENAAGERIGEVTPVPEGGFVMRNHETGNTRHLSANMIDQLRQEAEASPATALAQ